MTVRLLEREREFDELSRALDRAAAGEGSLTSVEGVAGIGKTSLLTALRERARAMGTQVLSGRGAELEHEFSFGIARQLFEPVLRASSESEQSVLLQGAAGLAGPLLGFPGDAATPPGSDLSFALLNALFWLTVNLADRGPTLVIIDDLQWADGPSLRWLSFLRARIDELPIAVVVAFRSEVRRPELAEFASMDSNARGGLLRPAPLTTAGSAVLTRSSFGANAASEFCDACHAATGGNPFLLRELLAGLVADGIRPSAESSGTVAGYRSNTVARWVLARLARLGPDAVALAGAVSILGDRVPVRRAAVLARLTLDAAVEATDRLASAEILQPGRPLSFVHAIVATAAHDDLGLGQRALLHKQASRILAAESAPAEEIAAHLLTTEPDGDEFVVARLREAAAQAQARGAPEIAVAYLVRALAEPPNEAQHPLVLHQLGLASFLARDPSALDHLAAAHRSARDLAARALIALDLAQYLMVVDRLDEIFPLLENAIDDLGDADEDLSARLEAQLVFIARVHPAHIELYHERMARLRSRRLEDTATGRQRMVLLVDALSVADSDLGNAVPLAERAFAGGRLLDELGPEAPLFYLGANALAQGTPAIAMAMAWCDSAIAESRKRGSLIGFALASCSRAAAMLHQGALAEAEADARTGLASGGAGTGLEPFTTLTLSSVLLERGEIEEAKQIVMPVAAQCEGLDYFTSLYGICARGRVRIAMGDLDGGLDDLMACGDWLSRFGISARGWIPWASDAALAHRARGQHDRARALAHHELTMSRKVGEQRALGIALRTSGLIEGDIDLLQEAVGVLQDSQARLEYARALVDLGAALRRNNHRTDARPLLAEGLDIADGCGALLLVGWAREELIAAGARPRRQRTRGIDSLTASERRIAQMASDGMTNREIAQALFITVKTVSSHLGHLYQKLDITSREQLRDAITR